MSVHQSTRIQELHIKYIGDIFCPTVFVYERKGCGNFSYSEVLRTRKFWSSKCTQVLEHTYSIRCSCRPSISADWRFKVAGPVPVNSPLHHRYRSTRSNTHRNKLILTIREYFAWEMVFRTYCLRKDILTGFQRHTPNPGQCKTLLDQVHCLKYPEYVSHQLYLHCLQQPTPFKISYS